MIKNFLTMLVRPHSSLIDVGEQWRVQLSMTFSLIITVGLLGPVLFGKHESLERDLIIDGLLLVSFVSYWMGRTRQYRWGPILLVFGITAAGFALAQAGETSDPAASLNTTLPLALVIGSAILSLPGLFFLTLLCGVGPMFLPLIYTNITADAGMVRTGGIFLVLGGLLISINILRSKFEKSRLDELRTINQALEATKATLEERVTERTALAENARAEAEVARQTAEIQVWFTQGQVQLAERMRSEQSTEMLANNIISHLCQYLGAQTGALFLVSNEKLKLTGRYAYTGHGAQKDEFGFGENLVGEAARENQMIHLTVIEDAPLISSSLGNTKPRQLLIAPIGTQTQVLGIVELATLSMFSVNHQEFLRRNAESIAIAFQSAQTRDRIAALLLESQHQAEELQSQEEELRAVNEELRAQAENMKNRF